MSMESWHVVGQKVVCVDNTPTSYSPICQLASMLQVGAEYEIASVGLGKDENGVVCVVFQLRGINHPKKGWRAFRFRPVRPTSIECFRSLLTPTPEQVRELEDA